MAITFVGSATGADSSGSAPTINFPAGVQQNDIVVYIAGGYAGSSGGVTADYQPSGYTEIAVVPAGSSPPMWAGFKRMGSTPDTSVTAANGAYTGLGAGQFGLAIDVLIFRGVDQTTAIDVTATTATGSSTNPDAPSITPPNAGSCIVATAHSNTNPVDTTPGTPTNYSAPVTATQSAGTFSATTAASYRILTGGAGAAENPPAFPSFTTGDWAAITLALRAASTGSTVSGVFASAGVGAASFTGTVVGTGVLSASGVGAFSAAKASTAASVFASAGVGTVSFAGAATFAAALSSSGVGVFNGAGSAVSSSVLSSAGVGTASFVGAATFSGVLSASGIGAFTGVGASTAAAVLNSAGVAVFSGALRTTFAAVLSSAGVGAFLGLSPALGSVASMAGVGTATFVGRSIASAVFSSSGVGTYQGAINAGVAPFSFGFVID